MKTNRISVIVSDHSTKLIALSVTTLVWLRSIPIASAHGGTLHAGTPHWILLGLLLIGIGFVGGGLLWVRNDTRDTRLIGGIVFSGAILILIGAIGLTEIQIEPLGTDPTPIPRAWYPLIGMIVGGLVILVSVNLGIWRWSHRPEYAALGGILGVWILYPVLLPATEYQHPLGYMLVVSVPILVSYIVWKDVWPAIREASQFARRTGVVTAVLFVIFLLFSTGQFTLNPEAITANPDTQFIVVTEYASPLVLWPAVEMYYPSIPFFGALSVGTVITFVILTGLVGTNAVLMTMVHQSESSINTPGGVMGGLATTGATACCCCAPAFYGVISAVFGISASPLYWTFLDPASPLGTIFFAGATVLMTGSTVQLARSLGDAGVCPAPNLSQG